MVKQGGGSNAFPLPLHRATSQVRKAQYKTVPARPVINTSDSAAHSTQPVTLTGTLPFHQPQYHTGLHQSPMVSTGISHTKKALLL